MLLGECPLDQLELGKVILAKSFYQLLIQEVMHIVSECDSGGANAKWSLRAVVDGEALKNENDDQQEPMKHT